MTGAGLAASTLLPWWKRPLHYRIQVFKLPPPPSLDQAYDPKPRYDVVEGDSTDQSAVFAQHWGFVLVLLALAIVALSGTALATGRRPLRWAPVPAILALACALLVTFGTGLYSSPDMKLTTLPGASAEPGMFLGTALIVTAVVLAVLLYQRARGAQPAELPGSSPVQAVLLLIAGAAAGLAILTPTLKFTETSYLYLIEFDSVPGTLITMCGLASAVVAVLFLAGRRLPLNAALVPAGTALGLCAADVLAAASYVLLHPELSSKELQLLIPDLRSIALTVTALITVVLALPWHRRPARQAPPPGYWGPPPGRAPAIGPPQPHYPAHQPPPAPPPPVPEPGLLAGRYRLTERIGQGGMGAIWRANDEMLRLDVAVKEVVFPAGLDENLRHQLAERALREARALARLRSHASIVTVHDVVLVDDRPWVIMELVAGRSLDKVIDEEGPLDPGRVARIALTLLDALKTAHSSGIVHRDVKPANVMIDQDDRVVLTDFGIAFQDNETALTLTGGLIGSPGYMAPERLRGTPETPAGDLWSLGATLYQAVEGRPAYHGTGPIALISAVLTEEPTPLRHAGPLSEVITGLMSRDVTTRWTADQAQATLQNLTL